VTDFSIRFWGTRGTVPTPGPSTLRYGGNTACVEVRCGNQLIILDAGTGIRPLGLQLDREGVNEVHLMISHMHMDHVHGFPFFNLIYAPGSRLKIYGRVGVMEVLRRQTEIPYFPVPFQNLSSDIQFIELQSPFSLGDVLVSAHKVNHPGGCYAFRFEYADRTFTYLTDHEPFVRSNDDSHENRLLDRGVLEFTRGANLLAREAQYTSEEYEQKRGWGHSTYDDAVQDAIEAGVERLALIHHDPLHDDEFLEDQLRNIRRHYENGEMDITMACEGQRFDL
jgi:phosphoribosyl 1,2-cyclic phosphodiesterase